MITKCLNGIKTSALKARKENLKHSKQAAEQQTLFSDGNIYCVARGRYFFAYALRPIAPSLHPTHIAARLASPFLASTKVRARIRGYLYLLQLLHLRARVYAIADNNSPFNVFGFWWLTVAGMENSYRVRRILFLLLSV